MFHLVSNAPKWSFKQIIFQILRFFHSGLSASSSSGSTSAKTVFGCVLENIKKIKIAVRLQYFIRNCIRQALDTNKRYIQTLSKKEHTRLDHFLFLTITYQLTFSELKKPAAHRQTSTTKHIHLASVISLLPYNQYLYIPWIKLSQKWGTNTFNSMLEKQSHWPPHSMKFWKETSILIHYRTTAASKWKQNS